MVVPVEPASRRKRSLPPAWRLLAVLVPLGLLGSWSPASTVRAQSRTTLRLPVLVLHHVKWDKPGDDAIELGLTIHPTQLRQELDYLQARGYHTVSAARVALTLISRGRLPAHPVVLTFDDGYQDAYRTVYPALRSRRMTGTFFVCPDLVGKPRYMTWRQVSEMSSHGMDIEAHTMTHPDLTSVPAAQQWAEIQGSRLALQSRLHVPVRVFAYPYGRFNAEVLNEVRRAGYVAAFTTQQGWLLQTSSRWTLPRTYVDRDDSLAQFAARLTGNLGVIDRDPS